MRIKSIKQLLPFVLLAISACFAGSANAHFYNGFNPAHKVQVLEMTCPAPTTYAFAEVYDKTSNTGILTTTLYKDQGAGSGADLAQSDTNYGDDAVLAKGAGVYTLLVTSTTAVSGSYTIQWHCMQDAATEVMTGVSITLVQP